MTKLPAARLALSVAIAMAAPLLAWAGPIELAVERAAREQLDTRMAGTGLTDAQYELTVVSARAAPACGKAVVVEPVDTRQNARMRFSVRCPGAERGAEYIVRAKISAQVAVAAAPLAANEVIGDASITLERRDVTNIADALGAPELALGQTTRRSLRAGEVLRASMLTAQVLVKRGDAVVMVARLEGIEVTTAGQALDAGARGAIVRVKNAASGQTVRMRVQAAGVVEPVDTIPVTPPPR